MLAVSPVSACTVETVCDFIKQREINYPAQRFFTNLYFNLLTIFFFYKKRLFIACSTRSEGEYSEQKS